MRQLTQLLCCLTVLSACSGCRSIAESLIDSAFNGMHGESKQERRDREAMEGYRRTWSTPGRTDGEIETEARGTFRKVHGREPNLNWHAS
jgi:hypothetical protein